MQKTISKGSNACRGCTLHCFVGGPWSPSSVLVLFHLTIMFVELKRAAQWPWHIVWLCPYLTPVTDKQVTNLMFERLHHCVIQWLIGKYPASLHDAPYNLIPGCPVVHVNHGWQQLCKHVFTKQNHTYVV